MIKPYKKYLCFCSIFLILAIYCSYSNGSQPNCQTCGSEPASSWYKDTMHTFFGYLRIHNPVNIYKLDLTKKPEAYATFCLYAPHAIWVNEAYFESCSPEAKLWHLATKAWSYVRDYENKWKDTLSLVKKLLNLGAALPSAGCGICAAAIAHFLPITADKDLSVTIDQSGCRTVKICGVAQALAVLRTSGLPQTLTVCGVAVAGARLAPRIYLRLKAILNNHAKTQKKQSIEQVSNMLLDLGYVSSVKWMLKRLADMKTEVIKENGLVVRERIEALQQCVKAKTGEIMQVAQTDCAQQASVYAYTKLPETVMSLYKEKVHEFLGCFHVKHPQNVPVYKFCQTSNVVLAHVSSEGIGINEDALQDLSESDKTFTLAHEAAHYSLRHTEKYLWRLLRTGACLGLLTTAPVGVMSGLLTNWGSKIPLYGKLLLGAGTGLAAGYYFSNRLVNMQRTMDTYAKSQEKEADLAAAEMLCDHGYQSIVQGAIQDCGDAVKAYKRYAGCNDHPSPYERYTYLQNFMEQWNKRHQSNFLSD